MQIDKHIIYEVGEYTFKNYILLNDKEKRIVLDWRNDDSVRYKMYNTDVIPIENHLAFIESLKNREDCYYWLVLKSGTPYGTMNLIHVSFEKSTCESGYLIAPYRTGDGDGFEYAKARIKLCRMLGVRLLYGAIRCDNRQAIVLSEYLGAIYVGSKYLEIEGEKVQFFEYQNDLANSSELEYNKLDVKGLVRYYKQRIKELS